MNWKIWDFYIWCDINIRSLLNLPAPFRRWKQAYCYCIIQSEQERKKKQDFFRVDGGGRIGKARKIGGALCTFHLTFSRCKRRTETISEREMFGKFNLILNTSNDKFIYDDRRLHRWIWEDWKKGKFLVCKVLFFHSTLCCCCLCCFHQQRSSSSMHMLMYSWRLFHDISQEWWKQFTFVGEWSDCSFSGSIKRTLDSFFFSSSRPRHDSWSWCKKRSTKRRSAVFVSLSGTIVGDFRKNDWLCSL